MEMVQVTINLPRPLVTKLKRYGWYARLSEGVETLLAERVNDLEEANRLAHNSKLTEEDALELGRKTNAGVARRVKQSLRQHKQHNRAATR